MYCAADEAPLVYNVKFAAVQMDANCFRGVYSVNCTQTLRAFDTTQRGGRLSIQESFAMLLRAQSARLTYVASIYCEIAKKTH